MPPKRKRIEESPAKQAPEGRQTRSKAKELPETPTGPPRKKARTARKSTRGNKAAEEEVVEDNQDEVNARPASPPAPPPKKVQIYGRKSIRGKKLVEEDNVEDSHEEADACPATPPAPRPKNIRAYGQKSTRGKKVMEEDNVEEDSQEEADVPTPPAPFAKKKPTKSAARRSTRRKQVEEKSQDEADSGPVTPQAPSPKKPRTYGGKSTRGKKAPEQEQEDIVEDSQEEAEAKENEVNMGAEEEEEASPMARVSPRRPNDRAGHQVLEAVLIQKTPLRPKPQVSKLVQKRTSTSPSPLSRRPIAPPSLMKPSTPITPTKKLAAPTPTPNPSPTKVKLPKTLPPRLIPSLQAQKAVVLRTLQRPPLVKYEGSPYPGALNQLKELGTGTIQRHEGNSCLILGPRGSGKTRLVEEFISSIPSTSKTSPVIIRLSAYAQTNDRLAMREIAWQVQEQIGPNALLGEDDMVDEGEEEGALDGNILVPAHLPSIIGALPCLGRPVIIILDAFDGFAGHARQALLYCLLDTVQSCRGGAAPVQTDADSEAVPEIFADDMDTGTGTKTNGVNGHSSTDTKGEHGLLVIGVTSRVDCLTILEKRVKSRFSHRVIRVGAPPKLEAFCSVLESMLSVEPQDVAEDWSALWKKSVEEFLEDSDVQDLLNETFAFGKDLRALTRLMISPILKLSPDSPWLTYSRLSNSIKSQRCSKQFPFLINVAYPHMALLISAAHTQTAGQDGFNFEMLYDRFMTHVRVVASAPMQTERMGLGMMNVAKPVMFGAFEDLVAYQIFRPVAAPAIHITKEFAKYRCVPTREDIRTAVEQRGQTNLLKWFHRNQ